MARTTAITGSLAAARRYRAEALDLAGADLDLTTRVLTAFDVPGVWTDNDDPALARRIADAAEWVLATGPEARIRARLLATIALELRSDGGSRALEAALEAERLAREADDPALLALALNARWTQTVTRAGLAPERARIGTELVETAGRHRLVTFEVLGHLMLVQAHSALADFAAADTHAAAADSLGAEYGLPLVGVFTEWYRALRLTVTGPLTAAETRVSAKLVGGPAVGDAEVCVRPPRGVRRTGFGSVKGPFTDSESVKGPFTDLYTDFAGTLAAEAAYRTAAARLSGSEMPGLDREMAALARHCLYRSHGLVSTMERTPPERPDLFLGLSACLSTPDSPAEAERRYALLIPAAGEFAGAGSGPRSWPGRVLPRRLGDGAGPPGRRALPAGRRTRPPGRLAPLGGRGRSESARPPGSPGPSVTQAGLPNQRARWSLRSC
ncbi:hypothetical protein [Amycolatopsis panacis]|uniref:hypothetical protein n=1 Tax=Amycolatopsis panacis TaxID=2340917 RepID=UPI0018F61BC0|nr:hypothetical protein [Amycolatopsis panacis]